jgi:hypothetical protein
MNMMSILHYKLVLVTLFGVLGGCASDQAHRIYGNTKYSPRALDEVALLSQAPDRPYLVIADFQSRGESPNDMRKRGAEIGADAVIVTLLGGDVSRSSEWMQQGPGINYSRITGTAIVYKK